MTTAVIFWVYRLSRRSSRISLLSFICSSNCLIFSYFSPSLFRRSLIASIFASSVLWVASAAAGVEKLDPNLLFSKLPTTETRFPIPWSKEISATNLAELSDSSAARWNGWPGRRQRTVAAEPESLLRYAPSRLEWIDCWIPKGQSRGRE